MWEAVWVSPEKAIMINGYRNLDGLLFKAIRLIAHERKRRGGGMPPMQRKV
jgi:hypothetical protein